MLSLLLFFTLHLTPPSSFHLLITENDGDSSNDDSSDEDTSDEDATTAAADEDSADANDDLDDLFPMAKTAPKKKGRCRREKEGGPQEVCRQKDHGGGDHRP